MRLMSTPMLFPLFRLDPQNPDNYLFAETDDFIANCLGSGTKLLYGLGAMIELSEKHYYVYPPKDYDKWAEICINIMRHYNEGWANGFHHNIEYWEIWNEPEGSYQWAGTWADYIRLYVTASKKIKQRFPNVKVGGPAISSLNFKLMDEFLTDVQTAELRRWTSSRGTATRIPSKIS